MIAFNGTPAPKSPRSISCADTAKLIRAALKAAFPAVKFSVRSSTYSMGASIAIRYIDGPTYDRVNAIAQEFAGATFDGMQDLKEYHTSTLNGEPVRYGADFVFVTRERSLAHTTQIVDALVTMWGLERPAIKTHDSGTAYVAATTAQDREAMTRTNRYWQELVNVAANDRTFITG